MAAPYVAQRKDHFRLRHHQAFFVYVWGISLVVKRPLWPRKPSVPCKRGQIVRTHFASCTHTRRPPPSLWAKGRTHSLSVCSQAGDTFYPPKNTFTHRAPTVGQKLRRLIPALLVVRPQEYVTPDSPYTTLIYEATQHRSRMEPKQSSMLQRKHSAPLVCCNSARQHASGGQHNT